VVLLSLKWWSCCGRKWKLMVERKVDVIEMVLNVKLKPFTCAIVQ
jgi:hypothetical protein